MQIFEEFHIEGNRFEILGQLEKENIEYLSQTSTPIHPLSKQKAINIVLKNQREDIFKLLELVILWNKTLKQQGYEEIKIYNNHLSFAKPLDKSFSYFKELYLEGEQITIFGELKRANIKYLAYPVYPKINHELGAVRIIIHQEDENALIEIIQNRNNKRKDSPIYIYNIIEPLEKKEMKEVQNSLKQNQPVNSSIDYIIPYNKWRIQYNPESDKIKVFELINDKYAIILEFFKTNISTELEKDISEIVNQYLMDLEKQEERKKA